MHTCTCTCTYTCTQEEGEQEESGAALGDQTALGEGCDEDCDEDWEDELCTKAEQLRAMLSILDPLNGIAAEDEISKLTLHVRR